MTKGQRDFLLYECGRIRYSITKTIERIEDLEAYIKQMSDDENDINEITVEQH